MEIWDLLITLNGHAFDFVGEKPSAQKLLLTKKP